MALTRVPTWSVHRHSAAAWLPAAHYVLLPVVGEVVVPEVVQKGDREVMVDQAPWEGQEGQGARVQWTSAV
jgi:hypothetical protein